MISLWGEGGFKESVCKFVHFQFKNPITNIVCWGHWTTETENCGKEMMNVVTTTLGEGEALNGVF